MEYSNDILIERLRYGDERVFEYIFHKYYNLLCYEAKGYIKESYLIEEIVCDVFVHFWLIREKVQIKGHIRDYLVKSVHNNCIDYIRHLSTLQNHNNQIQENYTGKFTLYDLGENPLDYMLTDELSSFINSEIEKLPDQCKKAFKLSRIENLSYEDIAQEMKISLNSVKLYIKNALYKLRESMKIFRGS